MNTYSLSLLRALMFLCVFAGLTACGQKGPLIVEEPPQEQTTTQEEEPEQTR